MLPTAPTVEIFFLGSFDCVETRRHKSRMCVVNALLRCAVSVVGVIMSRLMLMFVDSICMLCSRLLRLLFSF